MNSGAAPLNLIILAADKHIKASLEALLRQRPADLGIRDVVFETYRHPESDPGCRVRAVEFLRPFANEASYALVVFDHAGCGSQDAPEKIQRGVEEALERNGWRGRSRVIVISPELEAWAWNTSHDVARVLGWGDRLDPLRAWLEDRGLWSRRNPKPADPKEALRQALRRRGRVPSAALFRKLAASVDFAGCEDRAFNELLGTLRTWFPRSET